MKIILIGCRASGKSTVGRLLSRKLGIPFVDADRLIEKTAGMSIAEIVALKGWQEFRRRETQILASLQEPTVCVLATGGGAVLTDENRKLLKKTGVVIYLKADLPDVVERLRRDVKHANSRPPLAAGDLIEETRVVLAERTPLYEATADYTVDTRNKNIVQVAEEINRQLLKAGIVSEIKTLKKKTIP
ncbi:MAG: shikimate kinase AroL [Smithellaceae bacterium]|jgi:shikimate kinase|nr:shikimate kinase AroL [Smithellaceae bacterium]MDD3847842.1 shikimate kinase AroL [Smithellaceae bacterium]HOQ71481.1 shikimate kinase AroL [Smithellaceae bacterium]HPL10354.1 shikimate kinase AroL [Smithellaceae bacterium]